MWKIVNYIIGIAVASVFYIGAMSFYYQNWSWELRESVENSGNGVMPEASGIPSPVSDVASEAVLESASSAENFLSDDRNDAKSSFSLRQTYGSQGLILSGLPAYGRISFSLPLDAKVRRARLYVEFRAEIPDTVYATLRVAIRGTRRIETVLFPGREERIMEIDLNAEDLSLSKINVNISVLGGSTIDTCGTKIPASVVSVLHGTRIEIIADRSEMTVDDRLRMSGGWVEVLWQPLNDDDAARSVTLAAMLLRNRIPVSFSEAPANRQFSQIEMLGILSDGEQSTVERKTATGWPLLIGLDSSIAGSREFTGSNTWRYHYRLDDLPDTSVAGTLSYALRLGPMMDNDGTPRQWIYWIRLNGHLLMSQMADKGTVRGGIILPPEMQAEENVIEVTASRPFGIDGVCNAGPVYVAELLPETQILAGAPRKDDNRQRMKEVLGDVPFIETHGLSSLTVPEATALMKILGSFPSVPLASRNEGEQGTSFIKVVEPESLSVWAGFHVIYLDDTGRTHIGRIGEKGVLEQAKRNSVILLVSLKNEQDNEP